MSIELSSIARELKQPIENIQTAVNLLDEGNTIPFITRFRKDQTGGLTEDQLSTIKASVARLRALAERKAFVSKSIDSQGKLTDRIRKQIESARSNRELEDVYLPFKPKKQTLATVAKQNGLEPLAMDIFEGREPEKDLATRATDFVRVDKNLNSVDDVISGVKHILAEKFSDNTSLRNDLRSIIGNGSLATSLIAQETPVESDEETAPASKLAPEPATDSSAPTPAVENEPSADVESAVADEDPESDLTATGDDEQVSIADQAGCKEEESSSDTMAADAVKPDLNPADAASDSEENPAQTAATRKPKSKKKKKKKKADDPYKVFDNFSHPVAKMQYYKTLAINRGEKNGRLKVKVQYDENEFHERACNQLVPAEHPFKEFLQECVKDGMSRLVAPSLERETRREITEAAEKHAVQVFARNLKNLMLQSPVRGHQVLSVDPGYKRGCSVAVLDSSGQLLDNAHVFVVGNEKRRIESKEKLVELINKHNVTLIAIGNGAACREAEQMISDMLVESFSGADLKYSMVNEAGASFYSTSEVGREEFPDLSPAIRSAVSIGRRLIDPLSELVKISPANIGVGLYQHDVKAKHLAESLDDVVQFCVNRVGVDVNTASPSLLKYVSGLNQLTARRVYEYREENGPFKNREQLKNVSGFGDATFIQSAGFLRIHRGDQPLDTTGVHPEHYETAQKIIEKIDGSMDELFPVAASVASAESHSPNVAESESPKSSNDEIQSTALPTEDIPGETENGAIESEAESNVDSSTSETSPPAHDDSTSQDPQIGQEETPSVTTTAVKKSTDSTHTPKLTSEQIRRRKEYVKALRDLDVGKLAEELQVGKLLVQDIVHSVCRPEYDPRSNINRPVFRSGIIKIDDLAKDMQLEAQVVNVVDFGVFVDIGLGTSCLVHVSQLANHFIRDPHRFYAVGDSLKVWVTEVDSEQRRVKLTAVQPKSLKPARRSSNRKSEKTFSRNQARKGSGRGPRHHTKQRRKPKPKPVKPITDDMLTGAEPMRSFSDLAQFFNKQSDEKSEGKS